MLVTWEAFSARLPEFNLRPAARPPAFQLRQVVDLICRCGQPFSADSRAVYYGKRKSCGCLNLHPVGRKSGWTFNAVWEKLQPPAPQLLAVTSTPEAAVPAVNKRGFHRYRCRCGAVFGAKTTVLDVLKGAVVSCGCVATMIKRSPKPWLRGPHSESRKRARWKITAAEVYASAKAMGVVVKSSLTERVHSTQQVDLICHCGEAYSGRAWDLARGIGRSCGCVKSWPEKGIRNFVQGLAPDAVKTRNVIPPLELDVWVPSAKLAIEMNGLYWHGERCKGTAARADILRKLERIEAVGARGLFFFEDEWADRRPAIEGYIRSLLGQKRRVGARKCVLTTDQECLRAFTEANHLQGDVSGERIGLELDGAVIASATLVPARLHGRVPGRHQLLRYCVGDVAVAGGLSKLLRAYGRSVPDVREIVTYSDRRVSSGGIYRAAGFSEFGRAPPTYWYFKANRNGPRYHRMNFRKEELARRGWLLPEETEWACMRRQGYDRIWDAGKVKWLLKMSEFAQSDAQLP